ncbi:MAG: SMI1/KNR4 family protein [Bacteroidetes bacterium]|nr:SMI1/KNR4 family protein [Bacteroidota bacterium]
MNQLHYLKTIVERLKRNYVGLLPCSTEEIKKLEDTLQIKLPEAYREYLSVMGKYSGKINEGTDCFYDDLIRIQAWPKELLKENSVLDELPSDAFVFSMHQGYEFWYFRISEGNNPPVYGYHEGDDDPQLLIAQFPTFTDYILNLLNAYQVAE